jgi:hypothetical protein
MAPSLSAITIARLIAVAELKPEEVGIWKQDVNEMPAQGRQRRSDPARAGKASHRANGCDNMHPPLIKPPITTQYGSHSVRIEHRAAVAAAGRRS